MVYLVAYHVFLCPCRINVSGLVLCQLSEPGGFDYLEAATNVVNCLRRLHRDAEAEEVVDQALNAVASEDGDLDPYLCRSQAVDGESSFIDVPWPA